MNQPIDARFEEFKDETNHYLTMLLGLAWKNNELQRMMKNQMNARFDRLDERINGLHVEMQDISKKLDQVISKLSD